MNRRKFLRNTSYAALTAGLRWSLPLPAWARSSGEIEDGESQNRYDLSIARLALDIDGVQGSAIGVNGTVPGPLVRLREGEQVHLNVTNLLDSDSSIHWHGLILPADMDGVPGLSFAGIKPGDTYHYNFQLKQAGTYWYHSHSGLQEQSGVYGPLIIDPQTPEPFHFDREHVVVLSDWTFEKPETIFRNISLQGDYYNYQARTIWETFSDMAAKGFLPTLKERLAWGRMRMSSVDLSDVTGAIYTYLMNGQSPDMNWTGLFEPGQTVRLRFINASAMTIFDVRVPGLELEVVQTDGKNIKPVAVEEFRIGVAETYDVLVRPHDRAYTVFAESLDRSGFTRGTLTPELGLEADIPELRVRTARTLESIGMGGMADSIFGMSMDHHEHMDMGSSSSEAKKSDLPGSKGPTPFMPDKSNSNVAMVIMNPKDKLSEPGIGLGDDGWRVLTYSDLESAEPQIYAETPDREMTINITSNMERFMFSFDGKKFSEHEGPYLFQHNERLRLFLVNHTMMEHPIHLHGMWMQLENGAKDLPYKHTILVKPGEKLSALITPVEKGDWAFHCHLLYHMEAGMMQVVRVV